MSESRISSVAEHRFVAVNMNVAMRQLSEALGDEAVLVSSRRVAEGVEVVGMLPSDRPVSPFVDGVDRRQGERRSAGRRASDRAGRLAAGVSDHAEIERFDLAASSRMDEGVQSEPSDFKRDETASSKQHLAINLQQSAADLAQQIDRLNRRSVDGNQPQEESADVKQKEQQDQVMSKTLGHQDSPSEVMPKDALPKPQLEQEQQNEMLSAESLRKLLGTELERRAESTSALTAHSPAEFAVCHRLRSMQLDEPLVQTLFSRSYRQYIHDADEVPTAKTLWRCVEVEFQSLLPAVTVNVDAGGVFAFTGEQGSGKTSALLKLVAGMALRGRAGDVAVVSFASMDDSDSGRRLQRLARVSGIPMLWVSDDQSFDECLKRCTSRRTVLVDTSSSGNRHSNRATASANSYAEVFDDLARQQLVAELLCVDATSARSYMERTINLQSTELTRAVIATRTDLAEGIGALFSALLEKALPLMYLSSGSAHPDQLETLTGETIWQKLVATSETSFLFAEEDDLDAYSASAAGVNLTSDQAPGASEHNLQ